MTLKALLLNLNLNHKKKNTWQKKQTLNNLPLLRRLEAFLIPGHYDNPLILPVVSIVVPFLVSQNLSYRILTIKLVNQKRELQWRLQVASSSNLGGACILLLWKIRSAKP